MHKDTVKIALGVLATALVTGGASSLAFYATTVTREEMHQYVKTNAPWVEERGTVRAYIEANTKNVGKIERSVEKLVVTQQELVVEQRVMIEKIDRVLEGR